MWAIKISIVRFVDNSQPGWVEGELLDAFGREWNFVDKAPIFTEAPLDESSDYPQPGIIAGEIVKKWLDRDGREIVTVATEKPWAIESKDGQTQFDVLPEQLVNI